MNLTFARTFRTMTLVMVMALMFSFFSPLLAEQAYAASSRAASVVEVTGTAYLKKAGGTKPYRLFKKMTVNQGDTIITEEDSSVVLNVIDRNDEVTIGENSEVYMSDLLAGEGTKTGMKVNAGSVYSKVSDLKDSDTYKIETPNATMGVRGTHFVVEFNPFTGLMSVRTVSGVVEAGPASTNDPESIVIIYPSQQGTFVPAPETGDTDVFLTPLFTTVADPAIIQALLLNKAAIDQENEAMKEQLRNGNLLQPTGTLDLEAFMQNMSIALPWIVQRAGEQGIIDEVTLREIIEKANAQTNQKIDLSQRYDMNPNAADERMQRQREIAEQRKQQAEQRRSEKQQEMQKQNEDALRQIQERQQQLQQQNEQAMQEKQQSAIDRYVNSLPEEERQRFLQERESAIQDQRNANRPPTPTAPPPPGPIVSAPKISLIIGESEGQDIMVDVVLQDIPEGFYGAELHIVFNAEHFEAYEDDEGIPMIETDNMGEIFANSVVYIASETGDYTWADDQVTLATELVLAVTSTGEVTNGPVDDEVLMRIPLRLIAEGQASGSIILKEILFVDQEGNKLPVNITTTNLPYQFSQTATPQ